MDAYEAGQAIAELMEQRDDYGGEYDGEVYLYQSKTYPRRPRQVPAAAVLALYAEEFDVDPVDPDVIAGFLAALHVPYQSPQAPDEEPEEARIPEGHVLAFGI